jgi:hypothetical protein
VIRGLIDGIEVYPDEDNLDEDRLQRLIMTQQPNEFEILKVIAGMFNDLAVSDSNYETEPRLLSDQIRTQITEMYMNHGYNISRWPTGERAEREIWAAGEFDYKLAKYWKYGTSDTLELDQFFNAIHQELPEYNKKVSGQ